MKCQACGNVISKAELEKSAQAGDGAWCPKCVKRLQLNIHSKEIMWPATKSVEVVAPVSA